LAIIAILTPVIGIASLDVTFWTMTWPVIALFVKRFYDRGRSGWIILTLFVPICGLFTLMELLFMPTRLNQRTIIP